MSDENNKGGISWSPDYKSEPPQTRMSVCVTTVGTCSICGGPVRVPAVWMGIIPPEPTCASCGAVKADHGPVIQMKPRQKRRCSSTVPQCMGQAARGICTCRDGEQP